MKGDSVFRLGQWYQSHCDGDWEHDERLTIRTVDNPGWRVTVNLQGTFEVIPAMSRIDVNRGEHDWYTCWLDGSAFEAAGGPQNLPEMFDALVGWLATFDPSMPRAVE